MQTTAHKFMVALGAALGVLGSSLADGSFTSNEFSGVVIALAGAFFVWLVPNRVK